MCLTSDILVPCADESSVGGIKTVRLMTKDKIVSFTPDPSEYTYTAVTTGSTADVWYEIDSKEFGISFESAGELADNGPAFQNGTLTITIPKVEKAKSQQLNALAQCCKVVAIITTYENNTFVLGYDERLGTDAGLRTNPSLTIGAGLADGNFYTVAFTGQQVEIPRNFEGTILTSSGIVTIA
jgi:hypothetical protein